MSDLAISALPPASLALTGTELIPLVQSGQTVQTSVASLLLGGGGGGSALFNQSVSANPGSGPINDYSPAGWGAGKNRLLLMAASGGTSFNGLSSAGMPDGLAVLVVNTSLTDNLLFNNQNTGSLAANRFWNTNGGTILALLPSGEGDFCVCDRLGMDYMRYLLTLTLLLLCGASFSQSVPVIPTNTILGNGGGGASPAVPMQFGGGYAVTGVYPNYVISSVPVCAPYQVFANNTASSAAPICSSALSIGSIVVNTGGSISATGSGTIAATSVPASGITGAFTGDVSNVGPATTVIGVNGATVPASTGLLGSNGSSQLIAATSGSLSGGVGPDGASTLALTGTQTATTGTGAFSQFITTVFTPNGPINADGTNYQIHLGNAHGNNISNFESVFSASMTIDVGYTGTPPAVMGAEMCNQFTNNMTTALSSPVVNFRCFQADATFNGNLSTSGTVFNDQFFGTGTNQSGSAGAGAGGTINNSNFRAILPNGGSQGSGGVTTNRGLQITGSGGTNVTGTTKNWAIDSTSTADSEITGGLDFTPIGANSASTGAFTTLSASSTVSGAGFSAYLAAAPAITMSGTNAITPSNVGGIVGVTGSSAASAGNYGELQYVNCIGPTNGNQTINVTIASPAVVTWASAVQWAVSATNPTSWTCPIVFTSSGALPTGITSGTTYFVVGASVSGINFDLADTSAHALACTSSFGSCTGIINTTGTQSGTQTGTMGAAVSTTTWTAGAGMNLTAGDWDCTSTWQALGASLTTTTGYLSAVNTANNAAPGGVNLQNFSSVRYSSVSAGSEQDNLASPPTQELLGGTTAIYGIGEVIFGGGTATASALLRCRRMH